MSDILVLCINLTLTVIADTHEVGLWKNNSDEKHIDLGVVNDRGDQLVLRSVKVANVFAGSAIRAMK